MQNPQAIAIGERCPSEKTYLLSVTYCAIWRNLISFVHLSFRGMLLERGKDAMAMLITMLMMCRAYHSARGN
jgi:hypothetical protein